MVTWLNQIKTKSSDYTYIIFQISDGYLNTSPPIDQHKNLHKSVKLKFNVDK